MPNTRPGAKWPPNLTFHARRQAALRDLSLDRLTHSEQDEWRAATGYNDPPRWVVKDGGGKVVCYHYTLHDVITDIERRPTPSNDPNFI